MALLDLDNSVFRLIEKSAFLADILSIQTKGDHKVDTTLFVAWYPSKPGIDLPAWLVLSAFWLVLYPNFTRLNFTVKTQFWRLSCVWFICGHLDWNPFEKFYLNKPGCLSLFWYYFLADRFQKKSIWLHRWREHCPILFSREKLIRKSSAIRNPTGHWFALSLNFFKWL